ncbi:hypothetical protein FHT10_004137 [Xanthomonas arboricola]|nr:hypothetical protein [Xanthomonas cannabis]
MPRPDGKTTKQPSTPSGPFPRLRGKVPAGRMGAARDTPANQRNSPSARASRRLNEHRLASNVRYCARWKDGSCSAPAVKTTKQPSTPSGPFPRLRGKVPAGRMGAAPDTPANQRNSPTCAPRQARGLNPSNVSCSALWKDGSCSAPAVKDNQTTLDTVRSLPPPAGEGARRADGGSARHSGRISATAQALAQAEGGMSTASPVTSVAPPGGKTSVAPPRRKDNQPTLDTTRSLPPPAGEGARRADGGSTDTPANQRNSPTCAPSQARELNSHHRAPARIGTSGPWQLTRGLP